MNMICALRKDEHGFCVNVKRSCRNCTYYLRVQPHNESCQHALRGFCFLGQVGLNEAGNYTLYISASAADDCAGFLFDDRKAGITAFERTLAMSFDAWMEEHEPKVTRQLRKVAKQQGKSWHPSWFDFLEVRSSVATEWRTHHVEELSKIRENYDLKFAEYMQMLDAFSDFANHYVTAHPRPFLSVPDKSTSP